MLLTHQYPRAFVIAYVIFNILGTFFFFRHVGRYVIDKYQSWGVYYRRHRTSTQTPAPIPTPKPAELMTWIAWWDQPEALATLKTNNQYFTTISPSIYHIGSDYKLEPYPEVFPEEIINFASQSGIKVLPTVGNDLNEQKIAGFLANTANFSPAIEYLIQEATKYGFHGFDIDFENIPNQYESAFTQFIIILGNKLHQQNLQLSVAVHARTGSPNDWERSLTHNYTHVSSVADQVRLMAYDFHYAESVPGPITPLDKLDQVLNYALDTIPPDKIILGLPLYGYDWPQNGSADSLTFVQVQTRFANFQGTSFRDPVSFAMVGEYVSGEIPHTIWYEDADSTLAKIAQAQKLGIHRFVFWRLGGEDPDTWVAIASSSSLLKPGNN